VTFATHLDGEHIVEVYADYPRPSGWFWPSVADLLYFHLLFRLAKETPEED